MYVYNNYLQIILLITYTGIQKTLLSNITIPTKSKLIMFSTNQQRHSPLFLLTFNLESTLIFLLLHFLLHSLT